MVAWYNNKPVITAKDTSVTVLVHYCALAMPSSIGGGRPNELDDASGVENHLRKLHELGERSHPQLSTSTTVCDPWAIVNSVTSDPGLARSEFWITVSAS